MTTETKTASTAAIIIIGNEILSGRTPDANLAWLGHQLNLAGVRLVETRIIRDIEEEIISTVQDLSPKYDYIFTTGGIGPTHDDITAESMAKAFDIEIEMNDEAVRQMEAYYGEKLTEARSRMARIPVGATLIENSVSGAPGFIIDNVHVMAGVPRIMQGMFKTILPTLAGGLPMLSSTVACSMQESEIALPLAEIQKEYPNVDIGSYPHFRGGLLGLSVVLRATEEEALAQATKTVIELIRSLGGEPRAITLRDQEDEDPLPATFHHV